MGLFVLSCEGAWMAGTCAPSSGCSPADGRGAPGSLSFERLPRSGLPKVLEM